MQTILGNQANKIAFDTGFMERERVLTGSSFVCGLISGWQNNPQASLEALSQAIGNAGTPISRQGLHQRFNEKAVVFLHTLLAVSLEEMVKAAPVKAGLLSRFTSVDLVDSSVITLPNHLKEVWCGSGGYGQNASQSAMKLNVRLDVRSGQLKTLDLSHSTQHDRRSIAHTQQMQVGSLQIGDLGYFKLDDFERIGQGGSYWLTRYKVGTKVFTEAGVALDLCEHLPQQTGAIWDGDVCVGQRKRLRCRLVAQRAPAAVVRQRHDRLRETARQNQRQVTQQALDMAQWTIYLTNVPDSLLSASDLFVLGRYRWQIELLFKLWKSDLQVDQWSSCQPHRILAEVYGKLIAAIVTHWLLLVACWHNPRRSFRQVMHAIRGLAWQIANSLHSTHLLKHACSCLCRATSKSNMARSRADPRAWQLIDENIA